MNAEPTNLLVGPVERTVSLGRVSRLLLVAVPLFGLVGVGFAYTDLNINQRMFLDHLGCGCADGFNTNHLTMTLGFTCAGLALPAWWLAASGQPWKLRLTLTAAEVLALLLGFIVPFFRHNFWL